MWSPVLSGVLLPHLLLQIWVKLDSVLCKNPNIHSSWQNTLSQNIIADSFSMPLSQSITTYKANWRQIWNPIWGDFCHLFVLLNDDKMEPLLESASRMLWQPEHKCVTLFDLTVPWVRLWTLLTSVWKGPPMKVPCNFITGNRTGAEVNIKRMIWTKTSFSTNHWFYNPYSQKRHF